MQPHIIIRVGLLGFKEKQKDCVHSVTSHRALDQTKPVKSYNPSDSRQTTTTTTTTTTKTKTKTMKKQVTLPTLPTLPNELRVTTLPIHGKQQQQQQQQRKPKQKQ